MNGPPKITATQLIGAVAVFAVLIVGLVIEHQLGHWRMFNARLVVIAVFLAVMIAAFAVSARRRR